jgi:hypothetical protein
VNAATWTNTGFARGIVLAAYFVSFVLALILVAVAPFFQDGLKNQGLLNSVVTLYLVPLSIVIAGLKASKSRRLQSLEPAQWVLLYGSTALWNLGVLLVLVAFDVGLTTDAQHPLFTISQTGLESTLGFIKDRLAFIVSAALAFVYGSQ